MTGCPPLTSVSPGDGMKYVSWGLWLSLLRGASEWPHKSLCCREAYPLLPPRAVSRVSLKRLEAIGKPQISQRRKLRGGQLRLGFRDCALGASAS